MAVVWTPSGMNGRGGATKARVLKGLSQDMREIFHSERETEHRAASATNARTQQRIRRCVSEA